MWTRGTFNAWLKNIWAFANSPLVIALVSGLVIASIARSYTNRDLRAKQVSERRDHLDTALNELQQRLTYLESADRSWKDRCGYVKASIIEWDAVTGRGKYIPTVPTYANVNIAVLLTEADRNSGGWDPTLGAVRELGLFSEEPPRTALFIRDRLPWLSKYVFSHMLAVSIGTLPLADGAEMPADLQRQLGIPTLIELDHQADEAHRQALLVDREQGAKSPPCPERALMRDARE